MRNIGLILRVKWWLATRLLRDNLFDVFVLAPIILYGAFLAVGPQMQRLLVGLGSHPLWGFWGPKHSVLVLVAAKLLLSWRRLVEALDPHWCRVTGEFSVRGGIAITVTAEHARPDSS